MPTLYWLDRNEYGSNAELTEINGGFSLVSVTFG